MKKILISLLMISALGLLLGWTSSDATNTQLVTADIQTVNTTAEFSTSVADFNLDAEPVGGARCYQCDESGSTGKCAGSNRCRGTKDSCKDRGCKFTGGSSSSCTASNYKYCKE
jgi:hypothetical protein